MIQLAGLIRETFLEAVSKKVVIGFFVISTLVLLGLAWYFFASDMFQMISSLQPTADDPQGAALQELVYSHQMGIGTFFYMAAIFISIFMTAGILPSMMERGTIDLLLSKPLSRSSLLLGKVLGGFLVAAGSMAFFILGAWLIISTATGVWNMGFLLSLLPILLIFLSLYSLLVFVGVTTQSSALGMIICYLIIMIISPVLDSREALLFVIIQSDLGRSFLTLLYWIFPQVNDVSHISAAIIHNETVSSYAPLFHAAAFSAVFFTLSALVFKRKEF